MFTANKFINDEGEPALLITDGYDVWEEPIKGWEYVIHLCEGFAEYRHKDGRLAKEVY